MRWTPAAWARSHTRCTKSEGSTVATSKPHPLLDRRVLFFGGKGGVGKTTVTAAFGLLSARQGFRTLVVSTDPAPSTSDILQQQLTSEPLLLRENLWAMEINPATEVDRYIAEVQRNVEDSTPPRLAAEVRRQIDIARVSPGAEEAALFERLARLLEEEAVGFDRILFDTAPTGHTLHLLSLPETMTVWVSGLISRRQKYNALGRMWRKVAGAAAGDELPREDRVLTALTDRRKRFERARSVLIDVRQTAFTFVLTPERLPILETGRALDVLKRYRIPVGAVIANRTIPADADGEFMAHRRERESHYLAMIDEQFAEFTPYRIPLLSTDVVGFDALSRVIETLPDYEKSVSHVATIT